MSLKTPLLPLKSKPTLPVTVPTVGSVIGFSSWTKIIWSKLTITNVLWVQGRIIIHFLIDLVTECRNSKTCTFTPVMKAATASTSSWVGRMVLASLAVMVADAIMNSSDTFAGYGSPLKRWLQFLNYRLDLFENPPKVAELLKANPSQNANLESGIEHCSSADSKESITARSDKVMQAPKAKVNIKDESIESSSIYKVVMVVSAAILIVAVYTIYS